MLVSWSYSFYAVACSGKRPAKKFYQKILQPSIYLWHLAGATLLSMVAYDRNVILLYRGDVKPKEYKWYVDGVLGFVCLFAPMFLPFFFINYFKHFHEIKIGVTN